MDRSGQAAARSVRQGDATRELLASIGLTPRANAQDIETAHDNVVDFLRTAPRELHAWAVKEIDAADEAYALLSDPDTQESVLRAAAAEQPAAGTPGARTSGARKPAAQRSGSRESEAEVAVEAAAPSRGGVPSRALRPQRASWLRSRGILVTLGAVVVAGIVVGIYTMGRGSSVPGITGTPSEQASPSASATPLDQAKVAQLMQKIDANPKDVASLAALGDLYFQSADYKTASTWQRKVLTLDAKNVTAHLALGAAQFNLGNGAEAEKQWLQTVSLNPNLAEAHYDLGFLYLSQNPPNMAKVRKEWDKVVQIDPTSEIAKTVSTHLNSLSSASPSASPTPSASASGR